MRKVQARRDDSANGRFEEHVLRVLNQIKSSSAAKEITEL